MEHFWNGFEKNAKTKLERAGDYLLIKHRGKLMVAGGGIGGGIGGYSVKNNGKGGKLTKKERMINAAGGALGGGIGGGLAHHFLD